MVAVKIVVGVFLLAGLAGSILPLVPGTPLILAGAVIYAVATDFEPVGPLHLIILFGLAGVAYALDYLVGALGVKKLGGSGWAVAGALVGALAGVFFGPGGLLLGPVVGATAFELVRSRRLATGLRAGFGTVVGMALGLVAKFSISVVMVSLFLWWAWRG